jgi:hypothetical protein
MESIAGSYFLVEEWKITPKIRKKTGCSFSWILLKILLEFLARAIRQEKKKSKQIEEEEIHYMYSQIA